MNDTNLLENQPIAWTPTADVIERAQLTRFMKQVGVSTFDELYQFSITETEKFTAEVLKFSDIRFNPPYEKLLDTSDGAAFPHWCVGAGLNIVSHCVDRWQTDEMKDQPAIIWEGEEGNTENLTYKELFEQVKLCAAGLRADGFGNGDAIGIHLPMLPETVILLLAINRIGAIAVPVFSGYGVEAIASRMEAVGAKALFTYGEMLRRGKRINASQVAFEAAEKCPTIEKVFTINSKFRKYTQEERIERARKEYAEFQKLTEEEKAKYRRKKAQENRAKREEFFKELEQMKIPQEEIARVRKEMDENKNKSGVSFGLYDLRTEPRILSFQISFWKKLLESGKENLETLSHLEPTNAEDPLIILYTSGTTGKPKGIAHTHCSFPIKAAQDMAFGTDVGRGTRISWITDIGWMMGPWLIYGALINGATICIYDGAPDYPAPDRMWEFCAKHKVEILGISPTLVRILATHGDDLPKKHDLSSLRAFASTGEPWNPAPWWWLFEKVGASKLPIINYSGGTEISGGILMNNPLVPIKPCGFSAPCPGIDADVLDDTGESVGANQVGELAIKNSWIGMARGFWQEHERYLETYWSRFENVWVHGDWATRDADGHWFILGRSDDTLKVAGKRVGPAEVESLLVAHPNVAEAAVIGVPDEMKGTVMVAFCVLRNADILSAMSAEREKTADEFDDTKHPLSFGDENASKMLAFQLELKNLVAKDMGKPLAPSKIHFVSALPKTRNAKVMRRVIRAAYLGEDAGDLSALENPNAVEEIKNL
ncbi:MAG: AMP-binding protein [Acidobacteria bacterium]|nr:AMP-binding protein [Acidobacteriota bacterium]